MTIYMVVQYYKDGFGYETKFDLFKDKANAIAFFKNTIETFNHNHPDLEECEIKATDTFFNCYNSFNFEETVIYISEEKTHD